jgi:predicted DNA-binding transcriptional regulator AlpA
MDTDQEDVTQNHTPEFLNHHGVTRVFGFSRSFAYDLYKRGLIKSVNIRQRGALKGKRLFVADSIRAYLMSNIEEPNK